ncbi:unnamed protein product [Fusarium graminearum]|nr:unnamed protein product [Fusarium graminearum]CZS79175.1 unnamed protein product [Fusarium graminearum]
MSNSASRLLGPLSDVELAQLAREPVLESPQALDKCTKSSFSGLSLIKNAFRDTWRDIKPESRFCISLSRRLWWRFAIGIWILVLTVFLIILSFWMDPETTKLCRGDGDFSINITSEIDGVPYGSVWWRFSKFFEVTLAWGSLDFTTAKLIDVTWDLVVGRGGQATMSFIAWKVCTEYLEVSLATNPATYTTVWLLRFHQETSVLSSMRLLFQFFRRGLASKTAMWIIITTLSFILAFPTIASSMTGYTAFNNPYIVSSDDRLFPYEDVKPLAYIIHDGSRVDGFSDNYMVPWRSDKHDNRDSYWASCTYSEEAGCKLQANISAYITEYGLYAMENDTTMSSINETEFYGERLNGPPLNISAYYLPTDFYWGSPTNKSYEESGYNVRGNILFIVDSNLYNATDLMENAVCQPKRDKGSAQRYQWGFSFLQLYFVLIVLLLWSLAMGILWQNAHDMLELNHRDLASCDWRGLLDLTDTIRMQLDQAGIDIDNLSDKQLDNEIQTVLHGGSVSSQHMPIDSFSIWRWLWKKKWWIIFSISVIISMATEHLLRPYPVGGGEYGVATESLTYSILLFVPLYASMCISVAFAVGSTLMQKFVVFLLAGGLCVPMFFYDATSRDLHLPGALFGTFLAFVIGTTKGSRLVLFIVPFAANYLTLLIMIITFQ